MMTASKLYFNLACNQLKIILLPAATLTLTITVTVVAAITECHCRSSPIKSRRHSIQPHPIRY